MGSRFWRVLIHLAIVLTVVAAVAILLMIPMRPRLQRLAISLAILICAFLVYLLRERLE